MVLVEVVVGKVIGIFWTVIGFVGFFFGSCVVVVKGFFVEDDLLGRGFLVVALGGDILIWMRLSSARVVTGFRVLD